MADSLDEKKPNKLKVSDVGSKDGQSSELRLEDPDTDFNLDPRYFIKATIGKGGMSTVYLVHDSKLDKTLALKLLNSDLASDASAVKRFLQEAESAGSLDHENIVSTYGTGRCEDGRPFLMILVLIHSSLNGLLKFLIRYLPDYPMPMTKV